MKKWRARLSEANAAASAGQLARGGSGGGVDNGAESRSGDNDLDDKTCPQCGGNGVDGGEVCSKCNGSGSVMKESDGGSGDGDDQVDCPTCKGKGKIMAGHRDCPDCHGKGTVPPDSPVLKEAETFGSDLYDLAALPSTAWTGEGSLRESAVSKLSEKDYSTDTRVDMAKKGQAIPIKNEKGEITGGAFPIADKGDLEDAIQSIGRAGDPAEAKAHIIKNAKRLKATDMLPADWSGSTKESSSIVERMARLEAEQRSTSERFLRMVEAKPGAIATTFTGNPTRVKTSTGKEGYRVVLIKEGKGNAQDNRWYPGSAIREMVSWGGAEGMQAYGNHPTLAEEDDRPERDVKQVIGHYEDVEFKEADSNGPARAEAILVPVTLNESSPQYGWVVTLAEAAVNSTSPQPLCGISLYGYSTGVEGMRPDGSEGPIAETIRPQSADLVTNAGAGGGFVRKLMLESARRLRSITTKNEEAQPMRPADYQKKLAEATDALREAKTDEERTAAIEALDALQQETIESSDASSLAALTESNPELAKSLREAAVAEVKTGEADAQAQVREYQQKLAEAEAKLTGYDNARGIVDGLREAGVTDKDEHEHFANEAMRRGLTEATAVKAMVESERRYQESQRQLTLKAIREAIGDDYDMPTVEGAGGREGQGTESDRGESFLREAGIPVVRQQAAA